MSQAATEGGIQVACAVEGCHWQGPAAEAPAHDCPTPAADVAEPESFFAGMAGQDGLPIADEDADLDLPFHVIWTSADGLTIVRVGTRATEEAALELASETDSTVAGSVEVKQVRPTDEAVAEAEDQMTAASEPETQDELVAWLATFGAFTDDGLPDDEKTGRLTAKLDAMVAEEPDTEPEPEPELDVDAPPELPSMGESDPEPWEIRAAAQLETMTAVAGNRWLIIDETSQDGPIVGRAKVKAEATELLESLNALERRAGATTFYPRIEKTQDVLETAEKLQIERKRQLVPPEEPTQVDATPAEEPTPDEDASTEGEKAEEPEAKTASAKNGGLFDASDYDREDLALPKVDGHSIDKIALEFSGRVMLDRFNPDHVALFRRAKIDSDLELWIQGHGSGVNTKPNTNKDGDLDVVVSTRGLRVEAVRIVPAEGLDDMKDELAAQARDAREAGDDQ